MLRERAVTGLTTDGGVLALFLLVGYVRMAGFACLMAGEAEGFRSDFGNGRSAVVPVLSKAVWHEPAAYPQENQDSDDENPRKPKEMTGIAEKSH